MYTESTFFARKSLSGHDNGCPEFHYCVGSLVFHPKFIGQSFSTIAMVSALGAGSRRLSIRYGTDSIS